LTLAFVVGRLVSGLVVNLLAGAGFNNVLARLGLAKEGAQSERAPAGVVGTLILVAIMLFASIEAAGLLGFENLSVLLSDFVGFAGQVILGLVVFGVGLFLADVAAQTIRASSAQQASLLSAAARISIIVLAGAIALRQMGLANEIIELAFGLLLGSIAVAVALAFGLGGREVAARQIDGWLQSLRSKSG
ncbi:MAG: mechanosensitive ion channel, partial [bacterium]|nr:mechanosensitive ion channel [bacterium]